MSKTKLDFITTRRERLSYGSYVFGQNLTFTLIQSFLMLFLTDHVGIAAATVGVILFISKLWDAINDPIAGIIIDKTNFKRGKFKPWLILGMIILPITTILMFITPSVSPVFSIIWVLASYVLWDFSYTLNEAPSFAIVSVMTNNLNERVSLLSMSRFTGMIGLTLVSVGAMPLIMSVGWTNTAIVLSVLGFLSMLPMVFFVKERVHYKREEQIKLKDIAHFIIHNKYMLILYGAFLLSFVFNTAVGITSYFAIYVLGNPMYTSILGLLSLLPMLLLPIFLPTLIRKFGKKNILMYSSALGIIVSLILYLVGYANINLVFVLLLLRGISTAPLIMISLFTTDLIEYGHNKTGQRAEAVAFAIQSFITKLQQSFSGLVCGFALAIIGYQPNVTQSPGTINGIWILMSIIPMLSSIVLMVIVGFFYKLNEKDVQAMTIENQSKEKKAVENPAV